MKLQKNAFNSYNYIQITPKFNIVEFFVVNFICVRLFAVGKENQPITPKFVLYCVIVKFLVVHSLGDRYDNVTFSPLVLQ
jgi:hypothetical protein